MSSISSQQIFYINSSQRTAGTNGNFSFQMQLPPNSNFDRVCVLQANIPISFYIVPAGYNTMTLVENGTNVTITVPVGNYTALTFATTISSLLSSSSVNGWVYTVTLQTLTGKFTYSVANNTSQPRFVFTSNLFEQFGFNANSTNVFTGNTLTSANVVKFIPEDSLYIHSDIVNDGNDNILQEIYYNNGQTFANATYQCYDVECNSRALRTNQSNLYWFSITDENGRDIFLNGLTCAFSILLYKRDNFTDVARNYIKMLLSGV